MPKKRNYRYKYKKKLVEPIAKRSFIKILDLVKQHNLVQLCEESFFLDFQIKYIDRKQARAIEKRDGRVTSRGGVVGDYNEDYSYPIIEILVFEKEWYDLLSHKQIPMMRGGKSISDIRNDKAVTAGKLYHKEYEEFYNDPEIGDYESDFIEDMVDLTIAHEMAHCLQFWNCESGYDEEGEHDGHNDVWKKYYRILRRALGLVRK